MKVYVKDINGYWLGPMLGATGDIAKAYAYDSDNPHLEHAKSIGAELIPVEEKTTDAKNMKAGDLVRLKPVKVLNVDPDDTVWVSIPHLGGAAALWVKRDFIEEVLPRPLAVGDRVEVVGDIDHNGRSLYGQKCDIIAVVGDQAWVEFGLPQVGAKVLHISHLRRV